MANLNNFQKESINELLEFNTGITQLFQLLASVNNFRPDCFGEDDWKAFDRVLNVQEEAQEQLKLKIKEHISSFELHDRKDTE